MKIPSSSLQKICHTAVLSVALIITPFSLHAQTWTGANATSSPSWGGANNFSSTPAFNNTTDITFNTSSVPITQTWIGANRTIRSLSFGADVDAAMGVNLQDFNFGAARNLTFDTDVVGGNATISIATGSTGNVTIGNATSTGGSVGTFVLADNLVVDHNGSGLLLLNRPITGGFGITKSGSGTMELRAINSATGLLNIDAGTLIAGAQSATGLDINTFSSINLRGGTLLVRTQFANKTIDTAPVVVSSVSTLEMQGVTSGTTNYNVTFGGTAGFALNADLAYKNTSTLTTLTNGLTISRAMTGTGDITVDTFNNISSSADTYALGRLALTGDNSGWSGDLIITKGTVSLGGALLDGQASGTGDIVLGATGNASGAGLTFFSTAAGATTTTYANDVIVNSGGFRSIKGGNTDHGATFTGTVTLNGTLNVDHTLSSTRAITFGGNITGAGGLSITRNGGSATTSVVLTGTNSYDGGTAIASGATLSIGNGGTSGSIMGNIANDGTLIFNRSDDSTFAGDITGTGVLNKNGNGALTLGGNSNYGGITSVNVGALFVNGSLTTPTTNVASGARIGGDGTITGGLNLASGAQLVFALGSTLDVTGAVSLDNTFSIASLVNADGSAIDWTLVGYGTYTLIGTTMSDFSNISNFGSANAVINVGGSGLDAYFENGSLSLVVVPEPSTLALIALGLTTIFVFRRRASQS